MKIKCLLFGVFALLVSFAASALEVLVRDFRTVKDGKCVLFNIGTAAHGPSSVAQVMRFLPGAKVTFWADAPLSDELSSMMKRRFPQMEIVWGDLASSSKTNAALAAAAQRADVLVLGSSSGVTGGVRKSARDFLKLYPNKRVGALAMGTPCEDMTKYAFAFFRDELAYAKGREKGWLAPINGYAPDSVFYLDAVDEDGAKKFMAKYALESGKFVCAIPGNRYTPRWEYWTDRKPNEKYIAINEKYLESDHAPLRAAIVEAVRRYGVKVLICAEQRTELKLIKSAVYDKLPEDVKRASVCQEEMWGADLALSVYRKSRLVFGIEMHSQVMALGSGVPSVLFHHPGFGTKADMWRTIGVPEWRVDLLRPDAAQKAIETVCAILGNPNEASAKAAKVQSFLDKSSREMFERVFGEKQAEKISSFRFDRTAANIHSYEFSDDGFTPPPAGYTPFYISHYGRHGSRRITGVYLSVRDKLRSAEKAGILTDTGKSLLDDVLKIEKAHVGMDHELTARGAKEQQTIAQRMFSRFPTVFDRARKVQCRSTGVPRCLVSMGNFVLALGRAAPKLDISLESGKKIGPIFSYKPRGWDDFKDELSGRIDELRNRELNAKRFMGDLFSDGNRAEKICGSSIRFMEAVFNCASVCQCLSEELGGMDIYRFFTPQEALALARVQESYVYARMGNSVEYGQRVSASARVLARDFLSCADHALENEFIAADIRFGHDVGLWPFAGFLGLVGPGDSCPLAEAFEKCPSWKYASMASNVQFVFYRGAGDVLVKILWNEKETYPRSVKPLHGPYCRWDDVRSYIINAIEKSKH